MVVPQAVALTEFGREWTRAIAGTGFIPLSRVETEQRLTALAGQLTAALVAEPFSTQPAYDAGEALVRYNVTETSALEVTLALIERHLADLVPGAAPERAVQLRTALAAGYARALRLRTMADQEHLSRSILSALWASEARFRAVFTDAGLGIAIADTQGRIVEVNQAFADMLGTAVEDLRPRTMAELLYPIDTADLARYRQLVAGEADHVRLDKVFHRPDGDAIWTDVTISLIRDEEGQPRHTVAMVGDITDRYRLQERLRYQALHDPLTGLANRRLFAEQLDATFATTERVGLCCLDLDRFKYVNDSLGHEAGDQLLVAVARRLAECAGRGGYLAARMGGDEFILLVTDSTGVDQLIDLAKEVVAALAEPVQIGPHRLRVAASIGVVEQATDETTPSEITKAGDVTLQWAKSNAGEPRGGGGWAQFDPRRHAAETAKYELAGAMAAAIDAGEFTLVYQPLVRLADGAVTGVEALVRWRHPKLGLLPPDRFIGLAEETGLIVPLGLWILREACEQAARWSREAPDRAVFVSVNLAVPQTREPNLVTDIAAILTETRLSPRLLQLELTESAVMAGPGQPLQALQQLAEMGVRIAIDDFGTGYSNLAYLRSLPVHGLKLAGPFIEGLRHAGHADPTDEQIVHNLIRMAHAIGLTVTGEAVEAQAQADRLRALGCDLAQGWHLAPAVPPEQITAILHRGAA